MSPLFLVLKLGLESPKDPVTMTSTTFKAAQCSAMAASRTKAGIPSAAFYIVMILASLGTCCARGATNAAASDPPSAKALAIARCFEVRSGASWDTNLFRLHFVFDAFLSRALAHWVPVRNVQSKFRQLVEELCQKDLLEAWQGAGSVRFLRYAQKEDGLHCQYRLVKRSGQLAYWILVFNQGDGQAGIIDAHEQSRVPWLRHLAEGTYLMSLSDATWRMRPPGTPVSGLTQKSAADFREFLGLALEKKWPEALRVYQRLPPSVQSKEFVRLTYAAGLRASDRPDAKKLFEELTPLLTGNLDRELSALNSAYREKSLYALMAAARDLKEKNGPDAYLDVMQAQVHRYLGALADAEEEATGAVTAEPTLVEAHSLLIELALKKGDYATVARRIHHQEQILGIDLSHLAEKEQFVDFARSNPGRDWLASHGNRAHIDAAGSRTNSVEASSRPHKLQGIFLSNARPTAMIDGRTVEKGDRLPGGYVVQSITNLSVTLVDGSGAATVLHVK